MTAMIVVAFTASAAPGPSGLQKPAEDSLNTIPDFSGLWRRDPIIQGEPSGPALTMDLLEPNDGPGPLVNISGYRTTGIANANSPILKPWASEAVRKHGEIIRSGKLAPNAHTSCYPMSPPFILTLRGNVQFLQTPKEVTILYRNNSQARKVYMDRPHSQNPKPSYYGESVGRYEGEQLVVDTIGIAVTQFSAIDRFGTPHTDALHVVERYRIVPVNGERALLMTVRVEDPGTFNMPWEAWMLYYTSDDRVLGEHSCAENNRAAAPIPMDVTYRPPL